MSPKLPALGAALAMFAAASLYAGPVDPLGPDFLDIGDDGLALQAAGPICFTHGDTYCLENVELTATGPDNFQDSGSETDTFNSQLSGDLVDMTTTADEGAWLIPYAGSGTTLDVVGRASGQNGTFPDQFDSFDFSGSLAPTFPSFEIKQAASDSAGQTTYAGPNGDGLFQITSFFDIFTEISLDGGNNFISPNSGSTPTEFDLVASPEPGTFLLIVPALALLAFYRSRYKRA